MTGSGVWVPDFGLNGIVRTVITNLGTARPFGEPGDPQRFAQVGWIAAYEFAPDPDDLWPGISEPIINTPYWIDFEWQEFSWKQPVEDFFGLSGLAWNLFPEVEVTAYVWTA